MLVIIQTFYGPYILRGSGEETMHHIGNSLLTDVNSLSKIGQFVPK